MPSDPVTRPALNVRVLTRPQTDELFTLARERDTTVNSVIKANLGPLIKELDRRIAERTTAHAAADTSRKSEPPQPKASDPPPRQPNVHRLSLP